VSGTAEARAGFEYQPVLRGPLMDLRPLRASDHDALYAVARDPLIWEQHPDKARAEPEGFARFFRESVESGGALLATKAGTEEIVGSSRYHAYDAAASEVEIGWTFLAREYWGGVWNRELKRMMLEHAFRFVDRVVFTVWPANFRSQRAVQKLGAVRDGWRVNGAGRESFPFVLTRDAWTRELARATADAAGD
jgi:RimJ/RimL family protein N-acetyltransferase